MTQPIIGVLALQGAVQAHKPHIEAAGATFCAVRTAQDFNTVDAFIIPGGESTTMLNLIERFQLWDILSDEFAHKPVWGICAGAILMAKNVKNPAQKSFGLLPITIERNGYGRQLQSHQRLIENYPVSFIRAPKITDIGDCDVLATADDAPVWVRNGHHMASTFHPELTQQYPSPMHQEFVDMMAKTA